MQIANHIKKYSLILGLSLGFLTFSINSYAQESCDSTCAAFRPLAPLQKKNKTSDTYINFSYGYPFISYEYQNVSCPDGYRGRNGEVGVIQEKRVVQYYSETRITHYGEWIAIKDNCELIPVAPPSVVKTVPWYDQNRGYYDLFNEYEDWVRAPLYYVPVTIQAVPSTNRVRFTASFQPNLVQRLLQARGMSYKSYDPIYCTVIYDSNEPHDDSTATPPITNQSVLLNSNYTLTELTPALVYYWDVSYFNRILSGVQLWCRYSSDSGNSS